MASRRRERRVLVSPPSRTQRRTEIEGGTGGKASGLPSRSNVDPEVVDAATRRAAQVAVRARLGRRPPCESTIGRVLGRLDGDGLDLPLSTWIDARLPVDQGRRAVAVDGKTMRGTRISGAPGKPHRPTRHLLAVIDHDHARPVPKA
jgi:hypothetical protein